MVRSSYRPGTPSRFYKKRNEIRSVRRNGPPRDTDGYMAEIVRQMMRGLVVVATLGLILTAIVAIRAASENSEHSIRLTLQPIDSSITAGTYGILGAFVIALQFGARSMTAAQKAAQPGATTFLHLLSLAILSSSLALGFAVIGGQMANLAVFDLYRTLGPLALSLLIALPAAEASMLTDQRSDAYLQRVNHNRLLEKTREHLQRIPGFSLGTRGLVVQAATAALIIPATLGSLSLLVLPAKTPGSVSFRFGCALLFAIVAYVLLRSFILALITRDYSTLIFLPLMSMSFVLIAGASLLESALEGTDTSVLLLQPIARGALVFGILTIGPLLVLTPFGTFMRGLRLRGFILESVARSIERRLAKLRKTDLRRERRPFNPSALLALFLSPLMPFSILASHLARTEISQTDERGFLAARLASVFALILSAAALTALIWLSTVPVAGDWCTSEGGAVCWKVGP